MTDSHDELQERPGDAFARTQPLSSETEDRTKSDAREHALVGATIGRMPERRREVFCAVRIDGASYHEIGEQLGLTIDEVETEIAAALRQIRRARRVRSPAVLWRRWLHRLTYRPLQ